MERAPLLNRDSDKQRSEANGIVAPQSTDGIIRRDGLAVTDDERWAININNIKWPSMLFIFFLSIFLMMCDILLAYIYASDIGARFGKEGLSSSLNISYLTAVTLSQIFYSRLSDYRRKEALILSQAIFLFGNLLFYLGLRYNFWILVVARFLVGIGGGGMGFMVSLALNDSISVEERPRYTAGLDKLATFAAHAITILLSPLCARGTLRYIIFAELVITIFLIIGGYYAIDLSLLSSRAESDRHHSSSNNTDRMRQVDVKGSCLFAIFIILFVYNTSQIDFCLGWLTTTPIVLLNLVTMLTFLYVESQIESDEESLVPVRQAVRPEVWPLLLLSFLTIGAQSGILLSITKYVQVVGKHQPKLFDFDMRTILLSSLWVGEGLSAILAGTFSMKTPKSRWWGFLLAAVVFSACLGYMLLKWDGSQGWPAKILPVATAGCATGIFNYLFINLLKESSEEDRGILYGVLHLLGSLGAILTLCVLNQIHNNRKILAWYMKSRLPPKYDIEKLVKDCSENLDTCVDSVNKGDQDIVRQCFTDAIMLGFGVLLVVYIAILALVFTLPSKERATSLSLQDARSGREEN